MARSARASSSWKVGGDGLKVDEHGNVWATGAGVSVISPDGVRLGEIRLDQRPTNVTFGDPDGMSLYITAQSGLFRIRTNVVGAVR